MDPVRVLSIFLLFLNFARSEMTGFVKVSIPDLNEALNRITERKSAESSSTKSSTHWPHAGYKACLGRMKEKSMKEGIIWRLNSCGKLWSPDIQATWNADERIQALYLPINPQKISTNLILFPIKPNEYETSTTKDRYDWECDVPAEAMRDALTSYIPLMFPRDDMQHNMEPTGGPKLQLSLMCNDHRYGPKCDVTCDPTGAWEKFECHPQTGEMLCKPGWIGSGCQENVFIDRKTASQFMKSRPRRELSDGGCYEGNCTREELEAEFTEKDKVLTDELWNLYTDDDDCDRNTCDLKGTIFCEDLYQEYECHCHEGYKGENCTEPDRCHFEPCFNDAECKNNGNDVICDCLPGFEGKFCEIKIDPCLDYPCGFRGECENEGDGFRCVCDVGVTGELCTVSVDDCACDPCQNGGECYDGDNSYECLCEYGYHGQNCEKISDPCLSAPCLNDGKCMEIEGGLHRCICTEDYDGPSCAEPKIDPCASDPCNGQGECYSVLEEEDEIYYIYEQSIFCACEVGFSGKFCEIQLNACDAVQSPCPANATCINLGSEYVCACPGGYEGQFCGVKCNPCEENVETLCRKNHCLNDARCLQVGENTTCVCSPGYTGTLCETKIDFCSEDPCVRGDCISTAVSHECFCEEGFEGETCNEDIDECVVLNAPCKNGGECTNTYGSFECQCMEGFEGEVCQHEVDICSSDPCLHGGTCHTIGSIFMCECPIGYVGPFCEVRVDLCSDEPSPCRNGGQCEVISLEEQKIHCTCTERFYGRFCQKQIPPCMVRYEDADGIMKLTERTDCGTYGVCITSGNHFRCQCREGFEGEYCDQRVKVIECTDVDCKCDSTLPNFKALHSKVNDNTECNHALYGRGRCSKPQCILEPCVDSNPLICKFESDCFHSYQDVAPRIMDDESDKFCPTVGIIFYSKVLRKGLLLSELCGSIRNMQVMGPFRNDVVVECNLERSDSEELEISVAVNSKTSRFNDRLVALELFLSIKKLASSTSLQGENGTELSLKNALKNASYDHHFSSSPDDAEITTAISASSDNTPMDMAPSNDHDIVAIAVVCSVVLVLLVIGFVTWFRHNKATQSSLQRSAHSDSNGNTVPSIGYVKWSSKGQNRDGFVQSLDNTTVLDIPENVFVQDGEKDTKFNNPRTQTVDDIPSESGVVSRDRMSTFFPPNESGSNSAPTR